MDNKSLPPATVSDKILKFGNLTIKTEKPTQDINEANKGLDRLEKAAKDGVFISNEPAE